VAQLLSGAATGAMPSRRQEKVLDAIDFYNAHLPLSPGSRSWRTPTPSARRPSSFQRREEPARRAAAGA